MKSQTESKPFYKRIGLLGYIVAGMLTGVLAGWGLPDWAVRILVTFNGLFSQFLGFIIPLLILGLVAPAIVDIGRQDAAVYGGAGIRGHIVCRIAVVLHRSNLLPAYDTARPVSWRRSRSP